MSFAYLRVIQPGDVYSVVELIAMTPIEGVPPRPTPGPTPPDPDGTWGPNDPRPSNPIQLPPWVGKPQPPFPGHPGEPPSRVVAVVSELPADITPPAAPTAGVKAMKVWFGPGTLPTVAWVEPNASTGPVEPPAA